eukprot:CAMPEP_0170548582 /NCGR_PEP_ID=MMETSP0211-20121228/6864_1 /TAXON_ID=311385 /ORGANISM="Pseudokeronopsis sp., Strain OXSARD2" /LENGTH=92 /DNA_ID=CAMNT_0010854193 /DNA_START=577 /DNA_END=855 /DNA_ORIENTATION=-
MDNVEEGEHFKDLCELPYEAPHQVHVLLQVLEELIMVHMVDPLPLEELTFYVIQLLAETVRAYLIDKPVVFGLVNVIDQLGYALYAWVLFGV